MSSILEAYPGHPASVVLKAKRNDTFSKPIIGYAKDGTPFNFSGYTFRLQVRRFTDDDSVLIEMTDDSFTITQNMDGVETGRMNQVNIRHPKEMMDVVTGKWTYDLEMTDPDGIVQTIMEGPFIITKDRTRDNE